MRINLGFVSAVLGPQIAEALRCFREAHPSVQITLHDLPPTEQLQLIAQGKLDAGFVGLLPREQPHGLRFVPWCQERLLAFVPSGHPFAGRLRLDLAALANERFVAVSSEAAPAFSVLVHELCRKAGFRPRIVLESARAQAVAVMVSAGCGVAILSESLKMFVPTSSAGIPLKGSPRITHVFALRATTPPEAMKRLLELLTSPLI